MTRRRLVLALVAGSLVLYAANRLLTGPSGLNATYFDGPDWQRAAGAASFVDTLPSTATIKERRPDYERRPFSVEWRGFIAVPLSGTYTFSTLSDDGSWVYIRGREVVSNGGRHGPLEARGTIALDAGVHSIFVRYFQDTQDAVIQLSWSRDGGALRPVAASDLLTKRVSYPRVVAVFVTRAALVGVALVWYIVVGIAAIRWVTASARRLIQIQSLTATPALAAVIFASVLVNVCGIWWAMPNTRGWAPDEVVPADVIDAARMWFSNGWHEKYPPFHYMVLAAADSPVLLLSWLGLVDAHSAVPYVTMVLIGRFVSLAMGAATIVVIYACGRRLYGDRGAAFAALTTALTLPFAYHAKLANVDAPYLFWFSVSLLAYIRILQHHDRRDYLLFAFTAALAGCTKDQAWAACIGSTVAIVFARWRGSSNRGVRTGAIIFDRTTLSAAAVGLATVVLADNLLFNPAGFAAHVKAILAAPAAWQHFPATPSGQLSLAWHAIGEMQLMFGWPLAIVVGLALVGALGAAGTTPSMHWLLAPTLSYYVVFIAGILYFYDRFLLPITYVLSLYAGFWLERFTAPGVRARPMRLCAVAAVFAYSIVYVLSVDYAMIFDSRYSVVRWLRGHIRPGDVVGSLGPLEYQTIADGFTWESVESVDDLLRVAPAFVVLNGDQMQFLPERIQQMHQALHDGSAGYRMSETFRTKPPPLPGLHADLGAAPRHGREFSDLATINPTMEIFERTGRAASTRASADDQTGAGRLLDR